MYESCHFLASFDTKLPFLEANHLLKSIVAHIIMAAYNESLTLECFISDRSKYFCSATSNWVQHIHSQNPQSTYHFVNTDSDTGSLDFTDFVL